MAEFQPRVLIEASAGTGKTQELAKRLIALLDRASPREIVALTFSRAAAGEIFERFVSLLAECGEAEKLREVIATQHISQIGTLDSFLMRIVRAFPLELGLRGELEMMDDYRASAERARISFSILRRTDAQLRHSFVEAFSWAMNHEDVRSFVDSYRNFIKLWHEHIAALPDQCAWGDSKTIWGERVSAAASVTEQELAAAADALSGLQPADEWNNFAEWVRNFRGSFGNLKGFAKKLLDEFDPFHGASVEFKFGRKHYAFGGQEAVAIRTALMCVHGYCVRRALDLARGVWQVVSAFEREYAQKVRLRGRLVFADVPRLITQLPEDQRLALEYRLDSQLQAWALDEFQDTSREQWRALENLLDEARQSEDGRSVFIVGDRKQAIYGWRNGDVRIFERERDSGLYNVDELKRTWRSGPAIVDAVNHVFVDGRLRSEFPRWECSPHESVKSDPVGFVQCADAPGSKMEDFIDPVLNALRAVDPVRHGLSAAVLVRSNTFGRELADGLKARGLENVEFEGESRILDTPALSGFLDLVQLADHPGDQLAFRHFKLTPLAKFVPAPDSCTLSNAMSLAFTTKGLVRTFRELRALLPADPTDAWSEFTESRFLDMLRAAAEFELSREAGTRLADFKRYLDSCEKRMLAEPGKVKIMTIHRSKGLGFDYVVLPLYEPKGLAADRTDSPLVGSGWVLPDPGARSCAVFPELAAARQERRDREELEALCTYYVAMTRAKIAMTIVLYPQPKSSETLRFSELVRSSLGAPSEIGDRNWVSHLNKPAPKSSSAPSSPLPSRAPRQFVRRRLPSRKYVDGQSAGSLFLATSSRVTALNRGIEQHASFAAIEWLDPSAAHDDFDRAFVRREGDLEVWRERAYELFHDGVWESGQFDRVVISRDSAIVYDFKTNRMMRGESVESFERRMADAYRPQLVAYRNAVAALTGIVVGDIRCRLLLTATRTQVEI